MDTKSYAVLAFITGIILLAFGIYLWFFKEVITNKDIVVLILYGFANGYYERCFYHLKNGGNYDYE